MNDLYIFLATGIIFILGSVIRLIQLSRIRKSGIRTEGVIHDFTKDSGSSSYTVRYPIVKFTSENGSSYLESTKISWSPQNFSIGDKVDIIYEKNNPKNFVIQSKLNFFILMFFLFIGIAMTLFAIFKIVGIKF
jgi:hypothetical protein